MANYATLKEAIQDVIKTNGNNEITGALLQQSLLAMINSLGDGYQYMGVATPTTNPGTPDQNVFYIASESGAYSNFGSLSVSDGEVAILKYNGTWTKEVTGAATAAQVTELDQQINGGEINYEYGTTLAGLVHIYQGYQLKVPAAGTALSAVTKANGTNFRNARVPVTGASSVVFFQYSSTSGYGSMFVDAEDKVISGYSRTSGTSNPITLPVPDNAVYFIYSYTTANGASNFCRVVIDAEKIPTEKIEDGAVTAEKIEDGAVTAEKLADGAVDSAISGPEQKYYSYNLLNQEASSRGYINKTNGRFVSLSSGTNYATDYIPVSQNGIYAYPGGGYGSAGGGAVYDSNKQFLRATASAQLYTYQDGDAYVRFTYKTDNNYQVIVECFGDGTHPSISGTFRPPYHEQVIVPFNGTQVFEKENIPSLIPAFSLAGQDGITNTIDTYVAGTPLRTNGYPFYIKGRANVSARCKFSTFSPIYVGAGYGLSNGLAVYVTETEIQLRRFTGTDYNTTLLQSIDHGLTMTAFADVEVEFGFHTATARIVTATGLFLAEFNEMSNPEHYGQPFFFAPSGDFTNVSIRTYLKDFRRNVWVIGDSYTSMYQQRWTYQMIENMKIDSFLLDGLAGGTSEDMFPELERMLSQGTPKFLVWCLGMNDYIWQWMQYAKEVEMICRERGITLIYQTIPLPTSGYAHKQRINEYIKASGYRYIDSCDAVIADETTRAWYDGMLDDGVHPTVLGAKALAGQVLVDFPEIMQFNQ